MKPEVKALWVEALRDGGYSQGTNFLRTPTNEFCCLGVLCDLYDSHRRLCGAEPGWEVEDDMNAAPEEGRQKWEFLGVGRALPNEVVAWAGLTENDPIVEGHHLSRYNDGSAAEPGRDFYAIADLIEENL